MAEAERQASRNQSDAPRLKQQLFKLQTEARNITDAIAAQGHHRSPTLLARLTQVEAEVEAIQDRLNRPAFKAPNISEDEIRKFVIGCAGEFERLLLGNRLG